MGARASRAWLTAFTALECALVRLLFTGVWWRPEVRRNALTHRNVRLPWSVTDVRAAQVASPRGQDLTYAAIDIGSNAVRLLVGEGDRAR